MNRVMMGELSFEWIAWNFNAGADTGDSQLDEKTLEILLLSVAKIRWQHTINDWETVLLGRQPSKK